MPFTGSHPAAVLPLIRLGLVPSALVIGSMAPDLPYYLPLGLDSASTHSMVGIVGVDLLLGLLSFALWRLLVAPLAVALAPPAVRIRLPRPSSTPVDRRWVLLVVLSLTAGAATHVGWDEFTHVNRFGYRHLPWLAEMHGPLAGYRWVQYGSGVAGALLIGLAVRRWWRSAEVLEIIPEQPLSRNSGLVVLGAVALATLGGAVTAAAWAALQDQGVRRALFLIATWGGGAGLIAVLFCALLTRRRLAPAQG